MAGGGSVASVDAAEVGLALAFPGRLRAHLGAISAGWAPVEAAVSAGWAGLERLRVLTAAANQSVARPRVAGLARLSPLPGAIVEAAGEPFDGPALQAREAGRAYEAAASIGGARARRSLPRLGETLASGDEPGVVAAAWPLDGAPESAALSEAGDAVAGPEMPWPVAPVPSAESVMGVPMANGGLAGRQPGVAPVLVRVSRLASGGAATSGVLAGRGCGAGRRPGQRCEGAGRFAGIGCP